MIIESHKAKLRETGIPAARAMVGFLFFITGLFVVVDGATSMSSMLTSLGVPMPELMAWAVGIFKLVAGAALMFNIYTVAAAVGLIAFTAIASILAHFDYQDTGLWKNVAIIGGLMYVIAYSGPTPSSAKSATANN